MPGALYTLVSRRFPEGRPCEILRRIVGSRCFLVDLHTANGATAYAHECELMAYRKDDSCDGWDRDR